VQKDDDHRKVWESFSGVSLPLFSFNISEAIPYSQQLTLIHFLCTVNKSNENSNYFCRLSRVVSAPSIDQKDRSVAGNEKEG
jgi:hypothetical protein